MMRCVQTSCRDAAMKDYSFNSSDDMRLDDSTVGEDSDDTFARMSYERKQLEKRTQEQSAPKRKSSVPSDTTDHFTEPNQNLQVRLPRDLCKSLKLQSILEDRSISAIVLELLTTPNVAQKRHISRSRTSQDAA